MGGENLGRIDPLVFIQDCVKAGRIFWTYHVNMRMADRAITRDMIIESVENYEIIETYPKDKYLPSHLLLARSGGKSFHILFATDTENDNVRVVTTYQPSPEEWTPNMKTRKQQ